MYVSLPLSSTAVAKGHAAIPADSAEVHCQPEKSKHTHMFMNLVGGEGGTLAPSPCN